MLFITTRSGVIIRLDPITGEKLIAAKIPKRLSVPVEVAEQDPFVYVVADDSNIYVLSTEELKCVDAYYLGHAPGDVKIPPIYWSGHLMVAVSGSDYCDLHVLRVAEDRYSLERLQLVRLADAPVSSPPIKLGRNILFTSDRGDLSLMELVTTEAEAPLMKAAELKVENRGSGKAFVLAQGSNMWLASKGLMTFRVNKNAGQIERLNITSSSDVFLAPIQKIENVLIHARRRGGSRQISVAAVSVDSLEEFWRSEFGAPLAGAPALVSDRLMAVSSQGDTFEIKEADGAFVSLNPLNKASDIDQALNFNSQLTVDGNAVVAIGDSNSSDMVTFDATSNQTMLSRMVFNEEKVSLAAPPATLSQDFILPSLSGLILRVDRTGRSVGSPFAPPLAPGESVKWSRPATNSRDEILVADEKQNVFLLDASQRGSLTQIDTISIDSTIVSPFAANDDAGFAVAELNGKTSLRKFSFASPLTQMANVELPARLVAGPFLVNNNLVVHLDDGRIYGWSMDCEPLWNLPIPNERIGNVFEMPGTSSTFVLLERGAVLNLDQTGNITKTIELGQPVRHLPVFVDDKVYFTSANGAVLVVDRAQLQ
jgi:outer membrane protein assembly factor BamB